MNEKTKLEKKYVYIKWIVIFCGVVFITSVLIDYVFYPLNMVEHPDNIYYQGMALFSVIMGSAIIKFRMLGDKGY